MSGVWARAAAYEPYVGRWSRQVAPRFLTWLDAPPRQRWLDVGCGTGALTSAVLEHCDPFSVLGVDPSEAFLSWAQEHVTDVRAHFTAGDATHLPAGRADVVVSGLVLNFVPQPAMAVKAMRGATRGGTVAAYVWDYAGRMDLMRYFWDAAVELDPEAAELDEGRRSPMCAPEPLAELWTGAGLVDVDTCAIDVPTVFASVDDYWSPFLGGQGPAPAYAMSLEPERREALRALLGERLPVSEDGSVDLVARAWAVRGTRR